MIIKATLVETSIVLENLSPANDMARTLDVLGGIGGVLGQGIEGVWGGVKGIMGFFCEIGGL